MGMAIFEFICRKLPWKVGLPILALLALGAWYIFWLHEKESKPWLKAKFKPFEDAAMNSQAVDFIYSGFFLFVLVLFVFLASAYINQWYLSWTSKKVPSGADGHEQNRSGLASQSGSQPYSLYWEDNPAFTLQEAAFLWVGMEPNDFTSIGTVSYPMLQRLIHDADSGVLETTGGASHEPWGRKATRDALIKYCKEKSARPRFLFPENLEIFRDDSMVVRMSGEPEIHYVKVKNVGQTDLENCSVQIEKAPTVENETTLSSPQSTARLHDESSRNNAVRLSPGKSLFVDIAEWSKGDFSEIRIPLEGRVSAIHFIRPGTIVLKVGAYASNSKPIVVEFQIYIDDLGNFKVDQRPTQS